MSKKANHRPAAVRAGEAIVLVACGAVGVAAIGERTISLPAEMAALIPAIASVLLCGWIAWRGWFGAGIIVAVAGLAVSHFWVDHAVARNWESAQQRLRLPTPADSVHDAHLLADGVDLGPMPVLISPGEFLRRVPRWTTPPASFPQTIAIPLLGPEPFHCWYEDCQTWEVDPDLGNGLAGNSQGQFYFQIVYAGEKAAIAPGTAYSGGGFVFPQRDHRLQLLLDKARLADYHVSPDYFAAIETFDEDGWISLRKAAMTEPAMGEVLKDWATWKYHLDAVHSPSGAWAALQRICSEADQRQSYLSPSVAGRAVEMLAGQLDPQQLVDAGQKLIAKTNRYSYMQWTLGGRAQFGTGPIAGRMQFLGTDGSNEVYWRGSGGDEFGSALSPGGCVIVQAMWDMWKVGRGRELFQSAVGPDLLAWHYRDGSVVPMEFAAAIGGPEVDRFLLGQDWASVPESQFSASGMFDFQSPTNRWLYLLTRLDDDAGRRFRHEHAEQILKMGDALLGEMHGFVWDDDIDFLLADRELAWAFWPRFVAKTLKNPDDRDRALSLQYQYLKRIDAPPSAYIDAWRAFPIPNDRDRQRDIADQADQSLTPAAASALSEFLAHDPSAMNVVANADDRKTLLSQLTEIISPNEQLLATLRADIGKRTGSPESFIKGEFATTTLWLSRPGGTSPIVAKLASDSEPALRLLSLSAIRGMPTPANRQLLPKLLADPDASVRAEAQAADAELKALAARPVGELTSRGR